VGADPTRRGGETRQQKGRVFLTEGIIAGMGGKADAKEGQTGKRFSNKIRFPRYRLWHERGKGMD